MAKRTTDTPKTTSRAKKPRAAAGSAQPPVVPAEQTAKAVEQSTGLKAQQEDVRSSIDMASITHEMIAQRAYEIWKAEGGEALENWMRAERELRAQNTQQGNWR